MSGCCDCGEAASRFDGASPAYRRVLVAVIAINAALFLIELAGGFVGQSQALKADALDFLGDTATYSLTLYAVGRPPALRSSAALVKAASLAVLGAMVLAMSLYRSFVHAEPEAVVMGGIGTLALAANITAALLLFRFRNGDANVRSVWLCSRNDALNNLAVIAAAAGVAVTASPWPDLVVAMAMASVFVASASSILRQALAERREARLAPPGERAPPPAESPRPPALPAHHSTPAA
jgi:Co/Zn/Cd efflux system component